MTNVMQGVRILEVAEHTFVPAASAMLADLGAEVIKIEPIERGDAMRGLASTGVLAISGDVHALLHHSNRGKQSLALDLDTPEGVDVLYRLAATCDVFLTNKLPRVRKKLKIEVDDIRAHNPDIIYVRGTGQGERGPDADKGSYDVLAFWDRAGVAMGCKPADSDVIPPPPGPGFGDTIGATTVAAGIMGALYHRATTGEPTVVDVSLLASGMWAMGQSFALSAVSGEPWQGMPSTTVRRNPITGNYRTQDGRWLALNCMQAGYYWPTFCEHIGRPELVTDPRFADHDSLLASSAEAIEIIAEVIASATAEEWRARLDTFNGQWAFVQHTLDAMNDPQTVANGYMQPCETSGGTPFEMVAVPIQYDGTPAPAKRAPDFNEHGDAILAGLGLDWDTIIDLKVKGVVG